MGCEASKEEKEEEDAYGTLKQTLVPFEEPLVAALASGSIKLLVASYLRSGGLYALSSRQILEAREQQERCTIFLRPDVAANALRAADRRVCFVTHSWRSSVHPDPEGQGTFPTVKRFLHDRLGEHIVGVFIDFACCYQWPRTEDQEGVLDEALKAMAIGYASPLGTLVARVSDVPRYAPSAHNVVVVRAPGTQEAGEAVRAALEAAADDSEAPTRHVKELRYIRDKGVWRGEMGTPAEATEALADVDVSMDLGQGIIRALAYWNERQRRAHANPRPALAALRCAALTARAAPSQAVLRARLVRARVGRERRDGGAPRLLPAGARRASRTCAAPLRCAAPLGTRRLLSRRDAASDRQVARLLRTLPPKLVDLDAEGEKGPQARPDAAPTARAARCSMHPPPSCIMQRVTSAAGGRRGQRRLGHGRGRRALGASDGPRRARARSADVRGGDALHGVEHASPTRALLAPRGGRSLLAQRLTPLTPRRRYGDREVVTCMWDVLVGDATEAMGAVAQALGGEHLNNVGVAPS